MACNDLPDAQDAVALAEAMIAAVKGPFVVATTELLQDADTAMYDAKRSGLTVGRLHQSAARAVLSGQAVGRTRADSVHLS